MVQPKRRFSLQNLLLLALAGGAALAAGTAAARETARFTPTQLRHWAWKKPARPALPQVRRAAWVRSPIDAFVLARLEEQGIGPAPTATRAELIRRVAFDLTGLPPTPDELEGYLADPAPGSYERMVDRYLASPAFGERWARHWLDLARYSDSNGYEFDEARPDAWRYRDYVVRSFNSDKPYDRFVKEQLAGDQLAPEDPDARIATGFNLLGPDMTDAADQAARRQNTLNDMTDTAGLVFLGLTVGCARCHDHKYEPITIQDYYRLQAFFAPAQFRNDLPVPTLQDLRRYREAKAAHEARLAPLQERVMALAGTARDDLREKKIAALPEDLRTAFHTPDPERTVEQRLLVERNEARVEPKAEEVLPLLPEAARAEYQRLVKELRTVEGQRPRLPTAMGLTENGPTAPPTHVLERGELANRAHPVTPGIPQVLPAQGYRPPVPDAAHTGRRAALAAWIASPENPLTARVMVNRVWQHLFGRAILPTPSDFGLRGANPTNPELLDFLAWTFSSPASDRGTAPGTERQRDGVKERVRTAPLRGPAVASGSKGSRFIPHPPSLIPQEGLSWSMKGLIRLIVTSNSYKQSTRPPARTLKVDPENELFSRMNRKRLEAEAVRDTLLAVSGRLNPKAGGPGVFPPFSKEALPAGAIWNVSPDPQDHLRRSLYIFMRRNLRYPALEAFDAPDTNLSCERREVTTTAPQALALLNAPEMQEHARHFAARVLRERATEAERIERAYRLAFSRPPTELEARLAREFLAEQAALHGGNMEKAWSDYCLALMNLNELVYVE
ncbi:MAG: DUF1549 and DUF1553 domain-containing protein [Armatimonadota bacterium]